MNKVSKTVLCSMFFLFSQYSVAEPNLDEISQPAPVAPPPPDRYNMYTKDEFFQGIRDGRVWTLLTNNRDIPIYSATNIYTQDNQERLADVRDGSTLLESHLQRDFYHILINNYGLNPEFVNQQIQRRYTVYPNEIKYQLVIIALMNAPMYADSDYLKATYAKLSQQLSSLDPNFLESYKAFLRDYNDEWARDAPALLKNPYYLKKLKQEKSIADCKKSDNYKLYDSAASIKAMDAAITMDNMVLNLGGGSYQNQANAQSNKKGSIYIQSVEFAKYKKLGGTARTISAVTVPENPCK